MQLLVFLLWIEKNSFFTGEKLSKNEGRAARQMLDYEAERVGSGEAGVLEGLLENENAGAGEAAAAESAQEGVQINGEGDKQYPHNLDENDVIDIIKGMDDPAYIVWQEDYDRYAFIVRYFDGKKAQTALVSIDLDQNKDSIYLNGYEGGTYSVSVTMFNQRDLKGYLSNEKHVVKYDKAKDTPQRGSARKWASHLNGMPFADSIRSSSEKSNPKKGGHASMNVPAERTAEGNPARREAREANSAMADELADGSWSSVEPGMKSTIFRPIWRKPLADRF